MKTNKQTGRQTTKGLPIRNEQGGTEQTQQQKPETAKQPKSTKPFVNLEEREINRQLSTERVLEILRSQMPDQYAFAEIVGKWVWVSFADIPSEKIRADLSQLGFHWNNVRKCWQHPCGQITTGTPKDPREKYGSRFATDAHA